MSEQQDDSGDLLNDMVGLMMFIIFLFVSWFLLRDHLLNLFLTILKGVSYFYTYIFEGLRAVGLDKSVMSIMPERLIGKIIASKTYFKYELVPSYTIRHLWEFMNLSAYGLIPLFLPWVFFSFRKFLYVTKVSRLKRIFNIHSMLDVHMKNFPKVRPGILAMRRYQPADPMQWDLDADTPVKREMGPIRTLIACDSIYAYPRDRRGNLIIKPETRKLIRLKTAEEEVPRSGENVLYVKDTHQGLMDAFHGCAELDETALRKQFKIQLGKPFTSLEDLPEHAKYLAAVFMTQIAGDKNLAHKYLIQLAESFQFPDKKNKEHRVFLPNVMDIINSKKDHDYVSQIIQRHAYDSTLMMSLAARAQTKGKMPPDDYIWLKFVDRTLYMNLHQIGGLAPYSEGTGAWSHWKSEVQQNYPIKKPYFNAGVVKMFESIQKEGWTHADFKLND